MKGLNENSLDRICASLAYAMGIEPPKHAAPALPEMTEYIDGALGGRSADRVFMYNPDAIAEWIYDKYRSYFAEADARVDLRVPLCSVMPSVTPVCFGTMYTGAQPSVHGIQRYEKPVITIDTLFDALLRAGKRVALVTYETCSLSKIYLEREMDYFHYDDMMKVNAKAAELILRDEHDFIVVYNGNYDSKMHKFAPESHEALAELRCNVEAFAVFSELIKTHWTGHDTLVGFAMDHGCHEIDGQNGSHGLDMPEDLNIVHLYKAYPRSHGDHA
jgi:predicted AlkP superfamily pyrophosphatase or phosphodiesterase